MTGFKGYLPDDEPEPDFAILAGMADDKRNEMLSKVAQEAEAMPDGDDGMFVIATDSEELSFETYMGGPAALVAAAVAAFVMGRSAHYYKADGRTPKQIVIAVHVEELPE